MTTVLVALGIIGGAGLLFGLIILAYARSQKEAGKLEERDAQNKEANEAIQRANDVLAEHRDPDSTVEKLRRHEF